MPWIELKEKSPFSQPLLSDLVKEEVRGDRSLANARGLNAVLKGENQSPKMIIFFKTHLSFGSVVNEMSKEVMNLKWCCLVPVIQASSHSMWTSKSKAPANRPDSCAILEILLIFPAFSYLPFLCNWGCSKPQCQDSVNSLPKPCSVWVCPVGVSEVSYRGKGTLQKIVSCGVGNGIVCFSPKRHSFLFG